MDVSANVHANSDAVVFQHLREGFSGELRALKGFQQLSLQESHQDTFQAYHLLSASDLVSTSLPSS